jgi:hypothetical protein
VRNPVAYEHRAQQIGRDNDDIQNVQMHLEPSTSATGIASPHFAENCNAAFRPIMAGYTTALQS